MKKNKSYLIVQIICSFIGGLHMIFTPDKVSLFVIQGLGLIWLLEGILYFVDLLQIYQEKERKILVEKRKELIKEHEEKDYL